MINCERFDVVSDRYLQYWHRENHDRPLLFLAAPQERRQPLKPFTGTLTQRWLDIDYMLASARRRFENTYYAAEGYPHAFPNLGPDIFGAILGCELNFGESTSWAEGQVDDLRKLDLTRLDENNRWWKQIQQMTQAMAEDAKGDYKVGITDLHGGMDALVSLRGPEALCIDLVEQGDLVETLAMQLFDRFKDVYECLSAIIGKHQQGQTNWLGIYHPEQWYVTSSDFQGLISEPMMRRFVLPELLAELKLLKNSVFHLDGVAALRHLDCLLSLPELDGIQWVPGAGQAGAPAWLPVLKRIQDAGKTVHIDVRPHELPQMLEALAPEGIMYSVYCDSVAQADAMLKLAEQARPKRVF